MLQRVQRTRYKCGLNLINFIWVFWSYAPLFSHCTTTQRQIQHTHECSNDITTKIHAYFIFYCRMVIIYWLKTTQLNKKNHIIFKFQSFVCLIYDPLYFQWYQKKLLPMIITPRATISVMTRLTRCSLVESNQINSIHRAPNYNHKFTLRPSIWVRKKLLYRGTKTRTF